ncbi:MAG: iron transporter, partial [Clostridia bacterium]|nr:iron transporter [Clostridia bacterium]
SVTLSIKSPAENGYLLHVDDETGVEADGFWTEPLEATWTGWKFVKEW